MEWHRPFILWPKIKILLVWKEDGEGQENKFLTKEVRFIDKIQEECTTN
jgi:hypothetical protein